MDGDLFILFSLNNDATRYWLDVFGLSDSFDEDDSVLAVSYDVQTSVEPGADISADILLLYDVVPDHSTIEALTPFVRNSAKIFIAFHRGLDSPSDRARIRGQKNRLSGLCGKKLDHVHLIEHSTCGPVYDLLKGVADAVKIRDRDLYRSVASQGHRQRYCRRRAAGSYHYE